MKQLGNQDAGFVYNETPTTPMHISGLGIYDQSTAPGGRLGHKDIIKYVQDRIHLAPIFRYKFVEVPYGIDKPYWIEDPDFDVEFHLRHIALPQPGDWRQLCILISRLNSRPIDFNRPLWEAYIIEGLDNVEGLPKGSFAIMVKVHHSIVDGASGQSIFGALHDLSPDASPSIPDKPLTVERMPTTFELIGRALPSMVSRPLNTSVSFVKKAPKLLSGAVKLYNGTLESGAKLKVPQTRFNYSITPHRVFEGTQYKLDDIKAIKNNIGQGTTVNDVMLSIVAGGLRKYLKSKNELPDESLCGMLPQDIRTEATKNQVGNQVGGIFSDLHTDIEDPVERLLEIHKSTNLAKKLAIEVDTASIVQNYMGGFLNPRIGRRFNRLLQTTKVMERFGPFAANTLITNVPGPNFPLYHAGAKMVAYWGIPPLMDCLGPGHAIFSYCGTISLSAMACREMMPDPDFYIQCLNESFEEIFAASNELQGSKITKTVTASSSSTVSSKASSSSAAASSDKPKRKRVARRRSSSSSAATPPGETTRSIVAKQSEVTDQQPAEKQSAAKTGKDTTTVKQSSPVRKTASKAQPKRSRRKSPRRRSAPPETLAAVVSKPKESVAADTKAVSKTKSAEVEKSVEKVEKADKKPKTKKAASSKNKQPAKNKSASSKSSSSATKKDSSKKATTTSGKKAGGKKQAAKKAAVKKPQNQKEQDKKAGAKKAETKKTANKKPSTKKNASLEDALNDILL